MQNAIPAHIADSARNLFRECLRRADYVGLKHGNRETLRGLVRHQFRRNMNETDPIKIQEQKDACPVWSTGMKTRIFKFFTEILKLHQM